MKKLTYILAFLFTGLLSAQTIGYDDLTLAGGGGGGADQTITDFSITSNVLTITLENGGTETVDLSPYLDNTDSQTVTDLSITGTTLSITLSGGGSAVTVDLASLGSGESNANIVVASVESDLSSIDNVGKIAEIREDITLSGNLTLAENVKLAYAGGTINLNGHTITGNNTQILPDHSKPFIDAFSGTIAGTWNSPKDLFITNFGAKGTGGNILKDGAITVGTATFTSASATFTANDIGKFIAIVGANTSPSAGAVLRTTITGYTDANTVTIGTNALATVSGANAVYGYDNYNAVKNALYVRNQKSGNLFVPDGEYWHSAQLQSSTGSVAPAGWVVGNGTSDINIEGFGGTFRLIPHDVARSYTITTYKTKNSGFKNLKFIGDYELHPTEGVGKIEHSHCINYGTMSFNSYGLGNQVSFYYGDGMISACDPQMTNNIDGLNVDNASTDSGTAIGSVSTIDGTINIVDTTKGHSTDLLPLTSTQFQNAKELGDKAWFMVTGGSFGGWGNFVTPYYRAYFYDDSDTFIEASEILSLYDKIIIYKDEWKKVRIEFDAPANIDDVAVDLRPSLQAEGLVFRNNIIHSCGRQGISNPPGKSDISYNTFYNIGGLAAGPGYAIDVEDQRELLKDVNIEGNVIWDCWGGIKLIGATNVTITKNIIKKHTKLLPDAPTVDVHVGISSTGRNTIITDNITYNLQNTLDRQDIFSNNKMIGGILNYSANGSIIENNYLLNVSTISVLNSAKDRVGYPAIFRNNKRYYNIPFSGHWFRDDNNATDIKGDEITFNYIGNLSNLVTINPTFQETGLNDFDRLFLRSSQAIDYGGEWEGVTFKGILPTESTRDYSAGTGVFPMTTYKDCTIDHPMDFGSGDPVDRTIFDNTTVNSWIEFDLTEYSGVLSSPTTLTFKDSKFIIPDEYLWENANSNIFTTDDSNVNFVIEKCLFKNLNTYTLLSSQQRFMDLNHLGTTTWIDCTWEIAEATTIDMTNTSYWGATLGVMTFYNLTLSDNITLVKRSGDKFFYTRVHNDMPTYADDATAIADGYNCNGCTYKITGGGIGVIQN